MDGEEGFSAENASAERRTLRSSAFSTRRRAISCGVRPAESATGRLRPCRRRMWRQARSRSPSATREATGSGSAPFLGGLARSASAAVKQLGRAEGAGKPHAPAARQAERGKHRLEDRLVAERDGQRQAGQRECQQRMRVGERAGVGRGGVGVAEILDAGLEELVAALAALAEHLAEIGIAARRAGLGCDVVEADGNGEFRAQAERLAGLALGEENAAAQILARHVEERIGGLEHGHVDRACSARGEEGEDVAAQDGERVMAVGSSWRLQARACVRYVAPLCPADISPTRGEMAGIRRFACG